MAASLDRFRPGDQVRIRGERWRVAHWTPCHDAAVIDVAGTGAANRGTRASFLLPFEQVERVAVLDAPQVVRPAIWRRIARAALADATPSPRSLRAAARADLALVPFQLEPALAMTAGRGCRLLVADEVGLGKTVQAGLIVAEIFTREADAHALVVCPAGLREQWRGELEARFGLAPVVLDAAAVARMAPAHGMGVNPWSLVNLIVTSIDYLKRPEVLRCVEAVVWDVVVFDEAHALGGVSDRGATAAAVAERARRVVMLTATPHSGDEEAFRRMCDLGSLERDPLLVFRRTRTDAGIATCRRTVLLEVRPSDPEAAMHDALLSYARRVWTGTAGAGARLAMTVLMRRGYSSPASLARSLERRMALLGRPVSSAAQLLLPFAAAADDDDEPAVLLAAPGLRDSGEERRVLAELLALARRAADGEAKIAALARLLRRVHEPAIVFTEYRDTLAHLDAKLPHDAAVLHGGLTARQRLDAARAFTDGPADLLLATDAASEGLNLQKRCRLVINLELPWTPLRLEQRTGRVDRIGQTRTVHAVHLVARGTGEATIVARLSDRRARAQASLEQIGEAVIGGRDLSSSAANRTPVVVATVDLSREAAEEARRLHTARALIARGGSVSRRPAICVLRGRDVGPQRVWTWQLTFVAADGRLLWESLLPLRADALRGRGTREWARQHLAGDDDRLARIVRDAGLARLTALREHLEACTSVLVVREDAIRRAMHERQARLAAALLQPGLFDRRSERAAAAQAALLAEALARSDTRLSRLASASRPVLDGRTLVFAVALQ